MVKKKISSNDKSSSATESFCVYADCHTYPFPYSMEFNGWRGNAWRRRRRWWWWRQKQTHTLTLGCRWLLSLLFFVNAIDGTGSDVSEWKMLLGSCVEQPPASIYGRINKYAHEHLCFEIGKAFEWFELHRLCTYECDTASGGAHTTSRIWTMNFTVAGRCLYFMPSTMATKKITNWKIITDAHATHSPHTQNHVMNIISEKQISLDCCLCESGGKEWQRDYLLNYMEMCRNFVDMSKPGFRYAEI